MLWSNAVLKSFCTCVLTYINTKKNILVIDPKLAKEWTSAQIKNNKASNLSLPQQNRTRQPTRNHPDNNRLTCKTDAAWNKDKLVAGLGWVFSGPSIEAPINGSMVESSIGSPLIAEAFAAQSALCMVITLEFRSLEVFSDNLTLIRAISGEFQAKEIIGIVKDIRSISSEFANVSFSHFPRSENSIADGLAKGALQASLML